MKYQIVAIARSVHDPGTYIKTTVGGFTDEPDEAEANDLKATVVKSFKDIFGNYPGQSIVITQPAEDDDESR